MIQRNLSNGFTRSRRTVAQWGRGSFGCVAAPFGNVSSSAFLGDMFKMSWKSTMPSLVKQSKFVLWPESFFHTEKEFKDLITLTDAYADFDPVTKTDTLTITDLQSYVAIGGNPTTGSEFLAPKRFYAFDIEKRLYDHAIQPRDYEQSMPKRQYEFMAPKSEDSE